MRVPIARHALLVLDGVLVLADYVLNQRAAARNIQSLNSETDREERHRALFNLSKNQQVSFIFQRMDSAQLGMWFLPVAQRVNIGIASGKQHAIQRIQDSCNVI